VRLFANTPILHDSITPSLHHSITPFPCRVKACQKPKKSNQHAKYQLFAPISIEMESRRVKPLLCASQGTTYGKSTRGLAHCKTMSRLPSPLVAAALPPREVLDCGSPLPLCFGPLSGSAWPNTPPLRDSISSPSQGLVKASQAFAKYRKIKPTFYIPMICRVFNQNRVKPSRAIFSASQGSTDGKSARGLAHSTTLARRPSIVKMPRGLGVRQPSAALCRLVPLGSQESFFNNLNVKCDWTTIGMLLHCGIGIQCDIAQITVKD
jgi:hypothetical protein